MTTPTTATRFETVPPLLPAGLPTAPGDGPGGGLRLLHVVSSLSDSNQLGRGTVTGSSRLPVLKHVLQRAVGMCESGFNVTLVLIAAWDAEQRRAELTDALRGCGRPLTFGIWERAAKAKGRGREKDLPRKHRQLVRDLLPWFDVASCWEDDMLLTAQHVLHFLDLSRKLEAAAEAARGSALSAESAASNKAGRPTRSRSGAPFDKAPLRAELTPAQLLRIFPAFMRVEVLRGEVPRGGTPTDRFRERCCEPLPPPCAASVGAASLSAGPRRVNVTAGELVGWEWGANNMGVRRLPPPIGWVGVGGSHSAGWLSSFTGHGGDGDAPDCPADRATGRRRLSCAQPYFANQGGWMATRRQVQRLHDEYCPTGFFPAPGKEADWMPASNVESLSGGVQMFGSKACRVARIVSIDEREFASHLLLHSTGNKQLTKPNKLRSASAELGSLLALRSRAEGQQS